MPDVGILNLQIHDNSEQAGRGLNQFADALVRVQSAVGKGLQMGNVSRSLKSFATAVSENSRSLSNAGTFLNAITAYTKAFKNTEKLKFNSEPIDKLKAAIGDGIKIGQAGTQINKIREAFAGDWGSGGGTGAAITAMSGLANVAVQLAQANAPKVITDMAKAIGKYAEAQSKMPAGAADSIFTHVFPPNEIREASKQAERGIVDYMDAVKNFESAQKVTFREPLMKMNLQQFGGKGNGGGSIADAATRIEDAIRGANAEAGKLAENFKSVSQALQETLKVADEINKRTKSAAESVTKGVRESSSGPSEDLLLTLEEGASKLELMGLKLGILQDELRQGIASNKFDDKKVVNYSLRIEELEERIRKLAAIEDQAERADFLTEFAETYSTVEAYSMKASALEAKLRAGIQSGTYDDEKIANTLLRIYNIKMKIQALEDEGSRSDAMLVSDEAARDAADKYLEIHDNVDRLKTEIDVLKEKMGRGIISGTADESQLIKWAKQLDSMTERYEKLLSAKETVEESALPDEYVDSLDNTVEKLEDASDVVDEIKQKLSLDDTNGISQHITELDYLYAKLRDAKQVFNDYANTLGLSDTKTIKAGLEVSKLKERIDELKKSMDGASRGGLFSGGSDFVNSLDVSEEAKNSVNGAIESIQGLEELKEAVDDAGNGSKELTGDLGNLDKELKQKKTDSEEASGGLHKFRDACEAAKKGLKNMFPFLERVRNQFSRILLRRAIMAVLRSISEGFKEGVENVYRYSQAVGTSFAPAMDSAASKLLQMKNSVGAAVAPLIESLIPVLRQVVDWFIGLVNIANQFFALMNGQRTWTRALETTEKAYDDVKKSASGASKATKDLLADWDELNIIQSDSGGGAGSGAGKIAKDYASMFEEVSTFDDTIVNITDFIKDNFGDILGLVKAIGIGILGWKLGSALLSGLGSLSSLAGSVISVTIGLTLSYLSGYDIGRNGLNTTNLLGTITGIVASAIGGFTLFGIPGLIFGVVLSVFFSIIGYIDGSTERNDALKWGTRSLTPEEIHQYVIDQFDFDVEAEIEITGNVIKNARAAKSHFEGTVRDFYREMDLFHFSVDLEVDSDKNSKNITNALIAASEAVEALQGLIDDSNLGLSIMFKNISFMDDEGNSINDDLMSHIKFSSGYLSDYLTDLGAEMMGYILKGQRNELTRTEQERAYQIAESMERTFRRAEEIREQWAAESNIRGAMSGEITKESAINVLKEQREELKAYAETVRNGIMEDAEELYVQSSEAFAFAETELASDNIAKAFNLAMSGVDLKLQADRMIDGIEDAIAAKLEHPTSVMKDAWIKKLKSVYGMDITKWIDEGKLVDQNRLEYFLFGGDYEGAAQSFMADMKNIIGKNGFMGTVISELGIDPMLLLNKEQKTALHKQMVDELAPRVGEDVANAFADYVIYGVKIEIADPVLELTGTPVIDYINSHLGPAGRLDILGMLDLNSITDFLENYRFGDTEAGQKINNYHPNQYRKGFGYGMRKTAVENGLFLYGYDQEEFDATRLPRPLNPSANVREAQPRTPITLFGTTFDESVKTEDKAMVEAQNRQIAQISNVLVPLLQQILQKPLTVNLAPSSDWGQFNDRSYDRFSKVNGNP